MERALADALALWRRQPSSPLAQHIDHLNDTLAAMQPAVPSADWFTVSARRREAELGPLLAALPPSSCPTLGNRLDTLFSWPRDSRITEALRRLLFRRIPPATERGLWRRVLGLVAHTHDVRAAEWLSDSLFEIDGGSYYGRTLIQLANERISCLRGPLAHLRPSAPPAQHVVVSTAEPPPASATHRLVLADALLERGDPRGELIVLQSLAAPRRDQRRRIGALLREHSRPWLGRLSPAFKPEGLTFASGYVESGRLSGYRALGELVGAPEWESVRSLDLRALAHRPPNPGLLLRFLSHPVMKSLLHLRAVPPSAVGPLRSLRAPLGLQSLDLAGPVHRSDLDALLHSRALPRLVRLTIQGRPAPVAPRPERA